MTVPAEGIPTPRRRTAFAAADAFALIRETLELGRPLWLDATGGSMYPVVRDGNRVLLAPRARRPRTGDIVLARFGQRLVLHRVASVNEDRLQLRGDAAADPDPVVGVSDVIGLAVACEDDRGVRGLTLTLRYGVRALLRQVRAEGHRRLRRTAVARWWWRRVRARTVG